MATSLKEILSDIPFSAIVPQNMQDLQIEGITFHTKQVKHGFLFVPLMGVDRDGHDFIPVAIKNGAVAVVGCRDDVQCSVPYIRVPETHIALAYLAAAFHGFPARKLTVIGVTGTDGKTTTCNLIHQILVHAGIKAGMISTVNALIGEQVIDTGFHVTTPDAPDVQAYLAKMVDAGITHVVLEATSHGLAQERVGVCEFDIGAVTNITHEHMDLHGDYEHYLAAKAKLFTSLSETREKAMGNPRLAVLNRDDQSYPELTQLTRVRQIAYSIKSPAEVYAENIHQSTGGVQFDVSTPLGMQTIATSLLGLFNIKLPGSNWGNVNGIGYSIGQDCCRHLRDAWCTRSNASDRPGAGFYGYG
jgi:UDP-N-acetylmuramoyl-L-alanyl-D-glutamate--2,6-diaminopimelate ligase